MQVTSMKGLNKLKGFHLLRNEDKKKIEDKLSLTKHKNSAKQNANKETFTSASLLALSYASHSRSICSICRLNISKVYIFKNSLI